MPEAVVVEQQHLVALGRQRIWEAMLPESPPATTTVVCWSGTPAVGATSQAARCTRAGVVRVR